MTDFLDAVQASMVTQCAKKAVKDTLDTADRAKVEALSRDFAKHLGGKVKVADAMLALSHTAASQMCDLKGLPRTVMVTAFSMLVHEWLEGFDKVATKGEHR